MKTEDCRNAAGGRHVTVPEQNRKEVGSDVPAEPAELGPKTKVDDDVASKLLFKAM